MGSVVIYSILFIFSENRVILLDSRRFHIPNYILNQKKKNLSFKTRAGGGPLQPLQLQWAPRLGARGGPFFRYERAPRPPTWKDPAPDDMEGARTHPYERAPLADMEEPRARP